MPKAYYGLKDLFNENELFPRNVKHKTVGYGGAWVGLGLGHELTPGIGAPPPASDVSVGYGEAWVGCTAWQIVKKITKNL
ncbi:hypothetical protein Hanom_Chr03g00275291 [Helianthus anomalus]